MQPLSGVINVNKPPGITSHGVVALLRRLAKTKAGHTGTLDPQAEGVLPICLGAATRLAGYITEGDKSYAVEVIFGAETDTQDATGTVTLTAPPPSSVDDIKAAAQSFVGEYDQVPPMYSALKRDGKKLYELARRGVEVEREPRRIFIRHMDIVEISRERAVLDVRCSKGAYMRTLCEDLGRRLGSRAHMGRLVRTEAAGFNIDGAAGLDYIKELSAEGRLSELIIPMDELPQLSGFARLRTLPSADIRLLNGGAIAYSMLEKSPPAQHSSRLALLYTSEGRLTGIYESGPDGTLKSKTMLL